MPPQSRFPFPMPAVLPALLLALLAAGCAKVTLFPDYKAALQEFTLEGKGADKVLLVPLRGGISTMPSEGAFGSRPSLVQEITAQLDKAAKDERIRAVVLSINSPGGTSTGSAVLFEEIMAFRDRRKAPVVASLQEVAASGGYYAAMAADRIVAHETTITGSVGTIFVRPKVAGLFDKLGLDVEVSKSGRNKDMGSPFRPTSADEAALFQQIIDGHNALFLARVRERRPSAAPHMATIADARIFTGPQALAVGLVDELGSVRDALKRARAMASLPEDARVVAYRRSEFPDDNVYNPSLAAAPAAGRALVDLGLVGDMLQRPAGFYHVWLPEGR